MKRLIASIALLVLLILLSPILCRKYRVPLVSNGKVVAVATRPIVTPWNEREFDVYAGKSKAFGLWADLFDFPVYIYPFPDGKRFLCIDDNDTSVLVFVVCLHGSSPSGTGSPVWPSNDYVRNYMASAMTNIVIGSNILVRLPTYAELQETASNLASLTEAQVKTASFPTGDLGLYRFYWTRDDLLSEIKTNRSSLWPID